MMGECCGEACLPLAEMGSPTSSQSLGNASSLATGRHPHEQGRYKFCPTCWQLPPACGITLSLMQTKLWPASSPPLLSLTHTLGKAFDSNEQVKWGRDRGSPFSLMQPPPHRPDTLGRWKLARSFFLSRLWAPSGRCCQHTANTPHNGGLPKRGWGAQYEA